MTLREQVFHAGDVQTRLWPGSLKVPGAEVAGLSSASVSQNSDVFIDDRLGLWHASFQILETPRDMQKSAHNGYMISHW